MKRHRLVVGLLVLLIGAATAPAPGIAAGNGTELVYDGERMELEQATGQAVEGHTDLEAGTTLSVRIRSTSSDTPFLMADETVVNGDGTFRTVFDLSGVAAGTEFELAVIRDGSKLAQTTGVVVECAAACNEPVTDEGPTATESPESLPSDELGIKSVYVVDQGEVARLPVALGDADAATVTIGGPRVNYEATAVVRDGDGDGRVTLLFDTTAAGHDHPTLDVAGDADGLADSEESKLSARQLVLDAGDYPLTLHRGASDGREQVDAGRLVIRDAPVEEYDRERTETPTPERATEFGFSDAVVSAKEGQVTPIPLSLAGVDTATVVIGGPNQNFTLYATVEDGTGDDRVTVLLDTSAIDGDGEAISAAESGDSATVTDEFVAETVRDGGGLGGADYDMALHDGTAADGKAHDVGTLVLLEGTGATAGPATSPSDGNTVLSGDLGGIGALTLGGVLAVLGIAVLLGVVRL